MKIHNEVDLKNIVGIVDEIAFVETPFDSKFKLAYKLTFEPKK